MLKAVIFDLDNTLIDFMKMKKISCEQAIEAMIDAGLDMSKKQSLERLYKIYFKQGLENPKIFQKFLRSIEGRLDYRKLAYGVIAYRNARIGYLHPYPGVKKTLIKLKEKGLKLAIVTDAPKLKAWIRLINMGIDDFFDSIVALEDTGRTKPSKLPFKAALKELNLKPDECLMVGDWPQKDIKGAASLGMKTCFAKYGYEKKTKIKFDSIINSIDELVDVVNKLNMPL